jgi:hypothetical protein
MTEWRMRIACWITKAIDTHIICNIVVAFQRQQSLRERASVLRLCVYCLSYLVLSVAMPVIG